jgi:hypothetical protein
VDAAAPTRLPYSAAIGKRTFTLPRALRAFSSRSRPLGQRDTRISANRKRGHIAQILSGQADIGEPTVVKLCKRSKYAAIFSYPQGPDEDVDDEVGKAAQHGSSPSPQQMRANRP